MEIDARKFRTALGQLPTGAGTAAGRLLPGNNVEHLARDQGVGSFCGQHPRGRSRIARQGLFPYRGGPVCRSGLSRIPKRTAARGSHLLA